MKNTIKIILALLISIPFISFAQTDIDALRYSQTSVAGTARFISMAGAFGALGGDFSTLSQNPAGIAIYRKSEFSFSPSFYVAKTKSDFQDNIRTSNKYNFNFGNIGLVYTQKLTNDDSSPGWKNWNFGIGYNRINNFHTQSFYEGVNSQNSLLDYFLEKANANGGISPDNLDPFGEQLAFNTWLIDTNSTMPYHYFKDQLPGQELLQRRTVTTKGALSEIVISFGANYSNKLYLGGTIGFSSSRYVEESSYEESDKNDSINFFNNFQFNQNLTTQGYGINLKLGMIYRATDWVRIGAAFHTPTFYSMTDEYSNTMKSKFDNGNGYTAESPAGTYDYNLTTPMRVIGSIAFIIGKMGLISADYELVDYSEPRFDATGNSFFDVNDLIQKKYTATSNLRIGTEWRYQDFSFRGGYALYGSPFSSAYKMNGADMSKNSYCFGIGVRDQNYFIDFGYVLSKTTEYFQPYSLSTQDVPGVKNSISANNFTITLGAKF
ncbi:MAG: hypothetical protein NT126_07340 [Bacteroidetes bacterium]|nr:hypothetical protein [Bacteroidota bacterium]